MKLPATWYVKTAVMLALIAHYAFTALGERLPFGDYGWISWAGRTLILGGVSLSLWHYAILKKRNRELGKPGELVREGGLFPIIRHPMYLGDFLTMTGLLLLAPNLSGLGLWLVGMGAILELTRVEDRFLRDRFGEAFRVWSRRTQRLFPGLW